MPERLYEIEFRGTSCVIKVNQHLDNDKIEAIASRLPRRHRLVSLRRGDNKTVLTYGVGYGKPLTLREVEVALTAARLG